MPCFNHGRYVVESAEAILNQSFANIELIIVDDCSSDDSWEQIQRLAHRDARVKPIRHPHNQGASKSRNDGLRAAVGEFVGFCDADDVWEANKLERQLDMLGSNPECDLVYCDSIIIDEHGKPNGIYFSQMFPPPSPASGLLFGELVRRNFINMQSVLMRRDCMIQVGYFDEKIKWVEDWWYWVRVSHRHRFHYSTEVLARYRIHSASTNKVQKRGYNINRFKVYRLIQKHFPDQSRAARAEQIFHVGVELCNLGKCVSGRAQLWHAIRVSFRSISAWPIISKAMRRLILSLRPCKKKAVYPNASKQSRP